MALIGQSEITETVTPAKKNAITASTIISSNSGVALDYRRQLNKNREFIVGFKSSYNGSMGFNVGYRKYFYADKKLSLSLGADAGLKPRNFIGNGPVSRALETTFQKVDFGDIKLITGAYYQLNDNLDLMTEIELRSLIPFFRSSSNRSLKVGLKYSF